MNYCGKQNNEINGCRHICDNRKAKQKSQTKNNQLLIGGMHPIQPMLSLRLDIEIQNIYFDGSK